VKLKGAPFTLKRTCTLRVGDRFTRKGAFFSVTSPRTLRKDARTRPMRTLIKLKDACTRVKRSRKPLARAAFTPTDAPCRVKARRFFLTTGPSTTATRPSMG
jgi:hypothetical protein